MRLEQTSKALTILGDRKAALDLATQKLNDLVASLAHHALIYHHLALKVEPYTRFCLLPTKEVPNLQAVHATTHMEHN